VTSCSLVEFFQGLDDFAVSILRLKTYAASNNPKFWFAGLAVSVHRWYHCKVGTDFKISHSINYYHFGKHPTFWRLVLCPSTENNILANCTNNDNDYNDKIK